MKKVAIVTGASSGIGLEISKTLLEKGYKVYGIGRNFTDIDLKHGDFKEVICDVMEIGKLIEKIKEIKLKEKIYILVNNAGVGYFAPHEELNHKKIHEMVTVNLEVPLVLSQMLLRDLKKNKGYIINISSITAKNPSTYGCAYSATKAGISHFGESLFEESRKYGVKVITIHPDIVKTNFYNKLNFREGDIEESFITPKCVAEGVEYILDSRFGTVVSELTLRPQKHQIVKKQRVK